MRVSTQIEAGLGEAYLKEASLGFEPGRQTHNDRYVTIVLSEERAYI